MIISCASKVTREDLGKINQCETTKRLKQTKQNKTEHTHNQVRTVSAINWMARDLSSPTWWSNQMETFSALLAIAEGNSPVIGEFLPQRPVTWNFEFFSLICAWTNGWVNNRGTCDLRRHPIHYDVAVMRRYEMETRCCSKVVNNFIQHLFLQFNSDHHVYVLSQWQTM